MGRPLTGKVAVARKAMLSVGQTAPEFTAELDDGAMFQLAGYRGEKHVVVYFYPKDFTRG